MSLWAFFKHAWKRTNKEPLFDYLEAHAKEIQISAGLLVKLFGMQNTPREIAALIKESEERADSIVHEVSTYLDKKLITPIDKGDAKRLVQVLDDVVDNIDEAADLYALVYEFKETKQYASDFANEILASAHGIVELCKLLRNAGANAPRILEICTHIHHCENKCDTINRLAAKELFLSQDADFRIYRAWERIYASLEDASDRAEDCAKFAEQILHAYS